MKWSIGIQVKIKKESLTTYPITWFHRALPKRLHHTALLILHISHPIRFPRRHQHMCTPALHKSIQPIILIDLEALWIFHLTAFAIVGTIIPINFWIDFWEKLLDWRRIWRGSRHGSRQTRHSLNGGLEDVIEQGRHFNRTRIRSRLLLGNTAGGGSARVFVLAGHDGADIKVGEVEIYLIRSAFFLSPDRFGKRVRQFAINVEIRRFMGSGKTFVSDL